MNVTIIYGTLSNASMYNCVQLLLNRIELNMNISEFFLPKDLPAFNRGCFSYIINGEERRPHFNYVDSIVKSLDCSDLIILASPVFECDISTEMKSFLDHLNYRYMQDKTNYLMNNKIGLVMSTATGAGLFNTTRTLKRNLKSWGISKIFKFSDNLYDINSQDVSLKTNEKISKISNKILDLYSNLHTIKTPAFTKITSSNIECILKNNNCNVIDFIYWKEHSCFHVRN